MSGAGGDIQLNRAADRKRAIKSALGAGIHSRAGKGNESDGCNLRNAFAIHSRIPQLDNGRARARGVTNITKLRMRKFRGECLPLLNAEKPQSNAIPCVIPRRRSDEKSLLRQRLSRGDVVPAALGRTMSA